MPDNSTAPVIHNLKCWPEFFWPVMRGEKPFEIRKNDRDFKVGDCLALREYDPATEVYSGLNGLFTITYITDFKQLEGYVVMSIKPVSGGKNLSQILGQVQQDLGGAVKIAEG